MDTSSDESSTPKPEAVSRLMRKRHIMRLSEPLSEKLHHRFEKLAASQTWVIYWILHSLRLLEHDEFLNAKGQAVIDFMMECQHPQGGYGGGPGQIPHLATTFAAVSALISVASEEALESIDRGTLVKFLHRMKQPDGSFCMHEDGEIDSRATYCAIAVLRCLNIQDEILLRGVPEWLLSCQTYEGGFSSVPGSEAHGGYTFCCVASLCLLNQLHLADLDALLRWLTNKQMTDEGGFCGRSNKLVDSCYSYWQGAVFPILHPFLKAPFKKHQPSKGESSRLRPTTRSSTTGRSEESNNNQQLDELLKYWLMDSQRLQDYVLNMCQHDGGLFMDKPGVPPDYLHTCYALSGLSMSQHQPGGSICDIGNEPINILRSTHSLLNTVPDCLTSCFEHFANKKLEIIVQDNYQDEETRETPTK